jgi:hypothetical protein
VNVFSAAPPSLFSLFHTKQRGGGVTRLLLPLNTFVPGLLLSSHLSHSTLSLNPPILPTDPVFPLCPSRISSQPLVPGICPVPPFCPLLPSVLSIRFYSFCLSVSTRSVYPFLLVLSTRLYSFCPPVSTRSVHPFPLVSSLPFPASHTPHQPGRIASPPLLPPPRHFRSNCRCLNQNV